MRTILPHDAKLVPKQSGLVFKGVIHDVYHWQQKMYDGSYATYEMIKRQDTVKVIAIVDDKIVVVEQTQPDSPNVFYDIPGGRHDHKDETELEAAKRELVEETGLTFSNWKLVDCFQPSDKIEQFVYTFIANELISRSRQSLDNGEKISVHEMSYDEALSKCDLPNAKFMPKQLLVRAGSIDGLLNLEEYIGKAEPKQ